MDLNKTSAFMDGSVTFAFLKDIVNIDYNFENGYEIPINKYNFDKN